VNTGGLKFRIILNAFTASDWRGFAIFVQTSFMISWNDFEKVEIRTGTILKAEDFPEARKPAWKLTIDFGELGVLNSSAQITSLYKREDLPGKQVVAVVNFPPKQIGPFRSQCLVLGAYTANGDVVLLQPERKVENGRRIG